jgi:hypothetical protein
VLECGSHAGMTETTRTDFIEPLFSEIILELRKKWSGIAGFDARYFNVPRS